MISVVIPLYNKASHVESALRSVFAQSCQDFEVVVVNDGSTDRGPELVRAVKDHRLIVIDQSNAGVSAARNKGIAAARGELIAFLDADDFWNREFLATIIRLNRLHPEAGLYATAYQIRNGKNRMIDPYFAALPSPPWEGVIPNYFRSAALGKPPAWTSACCVTRSVLRELGGFAVGKRMGEDLDLWGRIALRYPVAFSHYKGAVYCQNAENRACRSFCTSDEHPFIETASSLLTQGSVPADTMADLELYFYKLTIDNMQQYVLSGNLLRARELASSLEKRWAFRLRRFLWGTRFNAISRILWLLRHREIG